MSSSSFRVALAAALLSTACSSEVANQSATLTPPPDPETLFDDLAAPTPEKLRGVWHLTQKADGGTLELRLRFVEKYLVGAVKCTPDGSDAFVIAGDSIGLQTDDLDAASGKASFATLGLEKTDNGIKCGMTLPGDDYDFTIEDGTLSFTTETAKLAATFTKVGD